MVSITFSGLLLAIFLLLHCSTAQTCYFPDGTTVAPNDVPCNASATAGSACCNKNNLCLDNGLCLLNGVMSRGSCTDPRWGSGCARYCETESLHGGITIWPCSGYGTNFSCFGNCDQYSTFSVPGGSAVMLRESQVAGLETTGPLIVGAMDVLHLSNTSEATTNTSAGSTASSSTVQAQTSEKRYTAADMAGVGVGVGAPLALAFAGTLFLLLKQRRQQAKPDSKISQEQYRLVQQPQQRAQHVSQSYSPLPAYHPRQKAQPQTATYPELDPMHTVNEMDADRERQELPNFSK